MNRKLMQECLDAMGVAFTPEQMDRLEAYDALLTRYNGVLKLVKAEGDGFVTRHYADSLVAVPLLGTIAAGYERPTVADLGSGPGLPGIPLAIALPSLRFSLVERMEKRAAFLRMVVRSLGLTNVEVVEQRLAEVRRRWEIVTCRAFHPFYDVAEEVAGVLADGGTVLLYKGRREKIDEEVRQTGKGWSFSVHSVQVPFVDAERALVVVKKVE